jgi:hypothetical protein
LFKTFYNKLPGKLKSIQSQVKLPFEEENGFFASKKKRTIKFAVKIFEEPGLHVVVLNDIILTVTGENQSSKLRYQ